MVHVLLLQWGARTLLGMLCGIQTGCAGYVVLQAST